MVSGPVVFVSQLEIRPIKAAEAGTFIGPLHDPAHNPTLAIHRNNKTEKLTLADAGALRSSEPGHLIAQSTTLGPIFEPWLTAKHDCPFGQVFGRLRVCHSGSEYDRG